MHERLRQRAARGEMDLDIGWDRAPDEAKVNVDATAVEQILFNLVDNASKYAASAEDHRIVVAAASGDHHVAIRVRDFGPGVPADVRGKLFKPFTKSAKDAAHSAPGVGLGLSLCRRLARTLGGSVRHETSVSPGACFVLELPRADDGAA
jgi:C4-dicarboxylate-specific signal transduction histidine kinase